MTTINRTGHETTRVIATSRIAKRNIKKPRFVIKRCEQHETEYRVVGIYPDGERSILAYVDNYDDARLEALEQYEKEVEHNQSKLYNRYETIDIEEVRVATECRLIMPKLCSDRSEVMKACKAIGATVKGFVGTVTIKAKHGKLWTGTKWNTIEANDLERYESAEEYWGDILNTVKRGYSNS